MNKPSSHLTPRDLEILKFIEQFRIGTDEILRNRFFPNVQATQAVRKVCKRLVDRRFLREFLFGQGNIYYVLAPRGARRLGVMPKDPKPFTEQSLPGALAIASFCSRSEVTRLTAQQFVTRFPDLCKPGLKFLAYFLGKEEWDVI